MPRKLKYGLKTKMKRVPIVLDEIINSICLKYGFLNEIERVKFIDNLNEETRKDFGKRKCEHWINDKCELEHCSYMSNASIICH